MSEKEKQLELKIEKLESELKAYKQIVYEMEMRLQLRDNSQSSFQRAFALNNILK